MRAGNRLGPYEIVALLDAGSMGVLCGEDLVVNFLPQPFGSKPGHGRLALSQHPSHRELPIVKLRQVEPAEGRQYVPQDKTSTGD